MPKLSVEDLNTVVERAQRSTMLRKGAGRAKVTVHMGTCGIASGARKIMAAIMRELENHDSEDVIVTTSGCAGLCSREPMVTVELRDEQSVKYADVTEETITEIVKEHLVNGRVVERLALIQRNET